MRFSSRKYTHTIHIMGKLWENITLYDTEIEMKDT
jgi:hypothetical protein